MSGMKCGVHSLMMTSCPNNTLQARAGETWAYRLQAQRNSWEHTSASTPVLKLNRAVENPYGERFVGTANGSLFVAERAVVHARNTCNVHAKPSTASASVVTSNMTTTPWMTLAPASHRVGPWSREYREVTEPGQAQLTNVTQSVNQQLGPGRVRGCRCQDLLVPVHEFGAKLQLLSLGKLEFAAAYNNITAQCSCNRSLHLGGELVHLLDG